MTVLPPTHATPAQARAAALGLAAARARDRSRELVDRARHLHEAAPLDTLQSGRRRQFALVRGQWHGMGIAAVVHRDGAVVASAQFGCLLRSEAVAGDPLARTLAVARRFDRLDHVEFFAAGERGDGLPRGCVAKMTEPETFRAELVSESADGHLLRFIGELDIACAATARERIEETAGSTVTLDLSRLRFMDASGLRSVLQAKAAIERRGHALRIIGARGVVRRLFEITEHADLIDD